MHAETARPSGACQSLLWRKSPAGGAGRGPGGMAPGIAGTQGCNSVQKGTLSNWQGAYFQEAHSPWTPSSGQPYLLIIPVEPEAHPLEILPQ